MDKIFNSQQLEILKKMQVVMLCGMVGAGKSTIAKKIAEKINAFYLSTDRTRWLEVFPYDLGYDYNNLFQFDRFTKKNYAKVYKKLWIKINNLIRKDIKVVIDATFLNRRRKYWATVLKKRVDNRLCLVYIKTDLKIIKKRIKKRAEIRKEKGLDEPGLKTIKYFQNKIQKGEVNWPQKTDAPYFIIINNNERINND